MASKHNIAAAIALGLLSLFPLFTFQYSVADSGAQDDQPIFEVIAQWPDAPRQAALELIEAYGPPDEVTSDQLVWHRTNPWEHTVVYRLDPGAPQAVVSGPEIQSASRVSAVKTK